MDGTKGGGVTWEAATTGGGGDGGEGGGGAGGRAFARANTGGRRTFERTLSPKPSRSGGGPGVEMEPLVKALSSEDADKVREAAASIRLSLKNNPENRSRLIACGGVDALVGLLASADASIVEHASTVLLSLSLSEGTEPIISAAGGVEAITRVLKVGTQVARENAAAALFTLSVPSENKTKVRLSGGIPPLVDLVRRGTLRGKKDAALALFNLTLDEACVREIVGESAAEVLVQLLEKETDPGMEDKVMAVLANLCKYGEGREAVLAAGGVGAMVAVVMGGSARSKEDAAVSLNLLATHSAVAAQQMVDEGAMPGLVKLGQSGTSRAKAKAKALLELLKGNVNPVSGRSQ